MRKWLCVTVICAMLLPISGCWDVAEVDEQIFVVNIGIDKADEGIKLTTQITSLASEEKFSSSGLSTGTSGSGGEGGGGGGNGVEQEADKKAESMINDGTILTTTYGRSLAEARDVARATTPRIINLKTVKYIVFSEAIAKDEGFADLLEQLWRIPRLKTTAQVFICEGEADEFLKKLTSFAGSKLVKTEESAINFLTNISYITSVKLVDLHSDLNSPYCTAYAISCGLNDFSNENSDTRPDKRYAGQLPRVSTNRVELFGAALFDRTHMVDKVSGYENQLMDMVRSEFSYGMFEVGEGDLNVTLSQARGASVKASLNPAGVEVEIWLEGSCDRPNMVLSEVEELCESLLKDDIEALLSRLTEQRIDPCRFGEAFAQKFSTIDEFVTYDYLNRLTPENIHVNVNVKVKEIPDK